MLLNRNLDSSLLVRNSSHQISKKILVILINKHLPILSTILHYHHHYPGLDYIVSHLDYYNNLPNDLHVSSLPSSCSLWTHAQSCLTLCRPIYWSLPGCLSMGFSRQEYWSGLPFPPLGDLLGPGIKPASPAFAGGFFTTEPPGKLLLFIIMRLLYPKTF